MVNINIDYSEKLGKIKPMHGVGQPPMYAHLTNYMHYLSDAGIPYSRLHDVGGEQGGNRFVDIPNIFRDFDADVNDPDSYDFAFTDLIIEALMKEKCEPIFRLGVSIENAFFIKRYRTVPPADFDKWARICEHIIRHYNEGWANGFNFGIKYWEIWNEPDNVYNGKLESDNPMWAGTKEEYYKLYSTTAKHLKNCFGDSIKVGGYASCGFYAVTNYPGNYGFDGRTGTDKDIRSLYFVDYFKDFFKYIKENNVPIDFFSWHSYAPTKDTSIMTDYCVRSLEEFGYGDIETHLNEWNNASERENMGSPLAAARYASMMCMQQNKKTSILNFYDARLGTSRYGGLFNPITLNPFPAYYSFVAFNELYKLGTQVKCDVSESDLYAIASTDGENKALLIANETDKDVEIQLNGMDIKEMYIIDSEHTYEKIDNIKEINKIGKETVILIK